MKNMREIEESATNVGYDAVANKQMLKIEMRISYSQGLRMSRGY